jgi:exonuclease SbcC
MTEQFDALTITDFRSVKGSITVPLNAPIVLIHGQNGAGKTSVFSALELALTGDIAAMRRADPDFLDHLVHQGATRAMVRLSGPGLTPDKANGLGVANIERGNIIGSAILNGAQAQFFAERCYLAQSTLGRLLEIYQHADTQKVSPLTRFVKDLLGLDYLEALIDGLHDAADIRRARTLVPELRAAEDRCKSLRMNRDAADNLVVQQNALASEDRKTFSDLLGSLPTEIVGTTPPIADSAAMQKILETASEDPRLVLLTRLGRELNSIQKAWLGLPDDLPAADRVAAETEQRAASALASAWRDDTGRKLEAVIETLRATFPELPSWASTNPHIAHETAINRVTPEVQRLQKMFEQDRAATTRIVKIDEEIGRAQARIKLVDDQLASLANNADGLTRALAGLVPYIHNEDCPVCSRNFAEVSTELLISHLHQKIARLTEQASRLSALALEKTEATARLTALQRDRANEASKCLLQNDKVALQSRLATLTDSISALSQLTDATTIGGEHLRSVATAQRRLAELRDRDRLATDLRANTATLCSQLGQPELGAAEHLTTALDRLKKHIEVEERRLGTKEQNRLRALSLCQKLIQSEAAVADARSKAGALSAELNREEKLLDAANARRLEAKAIAQAARDARTVILRRVFNDSLNKLWRELFVRLAPTEPFVPAFRLPETSEGVVAALKTLHRSGLRGGTPEAMLSAGNLNTAALTLFLALHLSVAPRFSWLVLDDPVQTMDELHIAQFAALLRTLSKAHGRKVLIAVHDRPLFDYLTLELSPAFQDDRLITVDLRRSADNETIAEPRFWSFQKDEGIAA